MIWKWAFWANGRQLRIRGMAMTKRYQAAIYLLTVCAAVTITQSASASIKCSNGFQVVGGNLLSTPYCQDQLVAEVAQQYGMHASAAAIRSNPNFKRHVCRLIGQDIRIKETCEQVNPTSHGRF
jgi:hypothetical protein